MLAHAGNEQAPDSKKSKGTRIRPMGLLHEARPYFVARRKNPHPGPPPEYMGRGKEARVATKMGTHVIITSAALLVIFPQRRTILPMRHVISALVINEPGVLANVAGMFAARGFNIDSLVVGRTDDQSISRMTIVVDADDNTLEQVRKQLAKLVPVTKVRDFAGTRYVERDLALISVAATAENRGEIIQVANVFGGRIVDVSDTGLIVELTAAEEKIEDFLELVRPYGVKELARTGVIAMSRGLQTGEKTGAASAGAPVKRKRSLSAPATVALPPS